MDRLIACFVLVCLTPLILLLLLITMFDLKYSPVFVQKRTVDGGKIFNFYKIRSMHKGAPVIPTPEFNEPHLYISRWGKFLRSNSLDELLNLICIIEGNMNFIGPRPIMMTELELLNLRKQYKITGKPGITGLAQINGRDIITVTRKVACERIYEQRKSSLKFRTNIFLMTIVIVLKKSGIAH
jgi:O-antigen biosynthesis protein WbqP